METVELSQCLASLSTEEAAQHQGMQTILSKVDPSFEVITGSTPLGRISTRSFCENVWPFFQIHICETKTWYWTWRPGSPIKSESSKRCSSCFSWTFKGEITKLFLWNWLHEMVQNVIGSWSTTSSFHCSEGTNPNAWIHQLPSSPLVECPNTFGNIMCLDYISCSPSPNHSWSQHVSRPPKAQLPCFRCTCMHVGYYRTICLCLCVCSSVHAFSAHSLSTVWVLMWCKCSIHCALWKKGCCNSESELRCLVVSMMLNLREQSVKKESDGIRGNMM